MRRQRNGVVALVNDFFAANPEFQPPGFQPLKKDTDFVNPMNLIGNGLNKMKAEMEFDNLYFSARLHSIQVELIEARDLLAADRNGFSDPYAIITYHSKADPFPHPKLKTKIVKKTLNPVWNQEFHVISRRPFSPIITITLHDKDAFSDDPLGEVNFDMALLRDGPHDLWVDVQPTMVKGKPKGGKGQVHLKFTHLPPLDTYNEDSDVPVRGYVRAVDPSGRLLFAPVQGQSPDVYIDPRNGRPTTPVLPDVPIARVNHMRFEWYAKPPNGQALMQVGGAGQYGEFLFLARGLPLYPFPPRSFIGNAMGALLTPMANQMNQAAQNTQIGGVPVNRAQMFPQAGMMGMGMMGMMNPNFAQPQQVPGQVPGQAPPPYGVYDPLTRQVSTALPVFTEEDIAALEATPAPQPHNDDEPVEIHDPPTDD